MDDVTPLDVVEPVHLGARLGRLAHTAYTEVDSTPVVCHAGNRHVYPLAPGLAALWPNLDGRPLHEAIVATFGPEVLRDPAAHRPVIEAVRRAKSRDLLGDVTSAAGDDWRCAPLAAPDADVDLEGVTCRDVEPQAPGADRPLRYLVALVQSMDDPDELLRPGVFDALAARAEQLAAESA